MAISATLLSELTTMKVIIKEDMNMKRVLALIIFMVLCGCGKRGELQPSLPSENFKSDKAQGVLEDLNVNGAEIVNDAPESTEFQLILPNVDSNEDEDYVESDIEFKLVLNSPKMEAFPFHCSKMTAEGELLEEYELVVNPGEKEVSMPIAKSINDPIDTEVKCLILKEEVKVDFSRFMDGD